MKLDYEYKTTGQNDNNGNVLKQTITTPTIGNTAGFTAIQTYNYDELNRLKSAEEKIANVTSRKQTFTFDRYGNKRFDEANTDTLQDGCATAVCNPTIDPAINKLIGYTFDNSGNTKTDATGQTFTYDGENKQIKVVSGSTTVGEYFYDGDGKRIKKIAGSEETIFIYNASGQLVAEYSTQISQTPKVSYLTADHLGSPRIITDMDGDVYTRRDFMPFGEEIDSTHTSQRTATLNYATDDIKQKFTSYERDNETELDFAQARMHNYNLGRFSSPDPLLSSGRSEMPSSWNRFIYVLNNPLRFVDTLGLYEFDPNKNWTKDEKDAFRKNLKAARNKLKKIKTIYGKKSEEYLEAKMALKSYGCEAGVKGCTDKNVVVSKDLANNPLSKNPVSAGGGNARRVDNGTRVQVTFDENLFKSTEESSEFGAGIAHEGVHVSDHFDYINNGTKISDYESERVGYVVDSAVGHVLQIDVQKNENSFGKLFDPSWRTSGGGKPSKKQQIKNIRNERNKRIDKMLASSPYGLTPQKPGNSYFP